MERYVVGFAFKGDAVLLICKNRPKWQEGKLNGIGGHVEPDESFDDAMVREFKEETGLDTKKRDWEEIAQINFGSNKQAVDGCEVHFYFSKAIQIYDAVSTTDEYLTRLLLCDVRDFPIIYNLNWLLPLCFDNSIKKPLYIVGA